MSDGQSSVGNELSDEHDTRGSTRHRDVDGNPEKRLRIDLLNAFYSAYKSGVSEDDVEAAIEYARVTAKDDAEGGSNV